MKLPFFFMIPRLKRFELGIILILTMALAAGLGACTRDAPEPTFTAAPSRAPTLPATPTDLVLPTATATPAPYAWTDENGVMSGLCFESVYDAAGQVFILRNADELNALYDLADNSGLCRRAVVRGQFDFSGGRILAGVWSRGRGCLARHEVSAVSRDDTARTFRLSIRLIEEGDCAYELVRPFWVGIPDAEGYTVEIQQGG